MKYTVKILFSLCSWNSKITELGYDIPFYIRETKNSVDKTKQWIPPAAQTDTHTHAHMKDESILLMA